MLCTDFEWGLPVPMETPLPTPDIYMTVALFGLCPIGIMEYISNLLCEIPVSLVGFVFRPYSFTKF